MTQDLIAQSGFGIELPDQTKFPKALKFEQDKTVRIALAWIEKNQPQMVHTMTHYVEGLGNITHKPGFEKILNKEPKSRVGTVAILWQTDSEGNFFRDEDDRPIINNYQILPFMFSVSKYNELQKLHKKFNLAEHDLEIFCAEEKYQRLTIQPHAESVLQKMLSHKKFGPKLQAEISQMVTTMRKMLARDVSEDQLKEALNLDVQDVDTSDLDGVVEDLIDDIG